MAWSPYKTKIIDFVSKNPGCSKLDVTTHCTYNYRRNPSKQYYIVNTALRNNWIKGFFRGGRYYLYINENLNG
ncbi:MAG TPA: hypothetical protein VFV86_05050 [Nitrososphaeraceae archaeon]|nr:hypothetical protein [Nitrososphaeraceae archaeon]